MFGTIITVLKKGISKPEHLARVSIEDSFNVGLEMVREHCRTHRGEARNVASISTCIGFINEDMKVIASKWFDVAISFKATYVAPPDVIEDFPAVPTIDSKNTSGYVTMGEVGAAAYYRPPIRAGEPLFSPSRRSRGTKARGSKRAGFCYAFDSRTGCHEGNCPYAHEKNPARTNGERSEATSMGARRRVGGLTGSGNGEGEDGSDSDGTRK
ncbi:unnamed protein product [Ectocarpus sp. CCAP 1310/34]|nr:unnamed protein product [Ectocarpus sp. CCAP 1310/34]